MLEIDNSKMKNKEPSDISPFFSRLFNVKFELILETIVLSTNFSSPEFPFYHLRLVESERKPRSH